jgi:hypothetical protein
MWNIDLNQKKNLGGGVVGPSLGHQFGNVGSTKIQPKSKVLF